MAKGSLMPELSLVIPFYNEEDNVRTVVASLRKAFGKTVDYELILVDNGSTDRSGAILARLAAKDRRLRIVAIDVNQGYGWGVLQGLKRAKGNVLGYMDGDGQIPGAEALRAYRMLRDKDLDICKITRVVRIETWARRVTTLFYNALFRLIFRVPYRDINGHPKLMKRETYRRLGLSSRDWFIDAEIILKGRSLVARFGEVPVVSYPREGGRSWVRPGAVVEFLINIIRFRIAGAHREGSAS